MNILLDRLFSKLCTEGLGLTQISPISYVFIEDRTNLYLFIINDRIYVKCNRYPQKVWVYNSMFPYKALVKALTLMYEQSNNRVLKDRYKKIADVLLLASEEICDIYYGALDSIS